MRGHPSQGRLRARRLLALAGLLAASGCTGVGVISGDPAGDQSPDGGTAPGADSTPGSADGAPTDTARAVVGSDRSVIGGLRVLLDGTGSLGERTRWEQIGGPDLAIAGADALVASVQIPANASPGTEYVFRLTAEAVDAGDVDTAELQITVRSASFERFLGPADLGNNEGIAFDVSSMWVVTQDFIDRFSPTGARLAHIPSSGIAAGANFDASGRLVVARYSQSRVDALDTGTNQLSTVITSVPSANYPLPDRDGNVYVSTRTGQTVLRHDAASQTTSVFLSTPTIANPNALAFGPEDDILYVGGSDGVYRVPILANGSAGTPSLYVPTGSEVDGLVFDVAGNLYIGCPNSETLYIAPYRSAGTSTPTRSFSNVGSGTSYFVNPVFGRGAFGDETLYYTNLSGQSVGRITVGLPALAPSLAP